MPTLRLALALALASLLGACTIALPVSDGSRGDARQVRLGSPQASAADRAALRAVNAVRTGAGLPPLRADARLQAAAKSHSDWMARTGVHSHIGAGGTNVATRIKVAGYCYRAVAENTGFGYPNARRVVEGWLGSAQHRRAIHDRAARDAAIAATEGNGAMWWTMVIGAPC